MKKCAIENTTTTTTITRQHNVRLTAVVVFVVPAARLLVRLSHGRVVVSPPAWPCTHLLLLPLLLPPSLSLNSSQHPLEPTTSRQQWPASLPTPRDPAVQSQLLSQSVLTEILDIPCKIPWHFQVYLKWSQEAWRRLVTTTIKSNTCYSTSYSCPKVLYNLRCGSWFAWASDTAAQYAAVHCPPKRTTGPTVCS